VHWASDVRRQCRRELQSLQVEQNALLTLAEAIFRESIQCAFEAMDGYRGAIAVSESTDVRNRLRKGQGQNSSLTGAVPTPIFVLLAESGHRIYSTDEV
jgi:hypothetical protein